MKKGLSNLLNSLKRVTRKECREWYPIYGMVESPVNLAKGTSSLTNKNLVEANAYYHAVFSYAPLIIGLGYGLNQIIS